MRHYVLTHFRFCVTIHLMLNTLNIEVTMTKIISIQSQKGGCSKTTLSVNLAITLKRARKSVLMIDTDPQGSSSQWCESMTNPDKRITAIQMERSLKRSDILDLGHNYDYVIIDGASRVEGLLADGIRVADLVLVPIQPSQLDVWAVGNVLDLVQTRIAATKDTKNELKAGIVITNANERHKDTKSLVSLLNNEVRDIPLVQIMSSRVSYKNGLSNGHTVYDSNDFKPKKELKNIATFIFNELGE